MFMQLRTPSATTPSFTYIKYPHSISSWTKGKYEAEIEELTRELEAMRGKWTKSRDEAAKKDKELIVVKEALQQALEVSTARKQLFSAVCLVWQRFFKFKSETVFRLKSISRSRKVKY